MKKSLFPFNGSFISFGFLCLFSVAFNISCSVNSQEPAEITEAGDLFAPLISLNGIVYKSDYAGSQPDLVQGVSPVPATGNPLIRHAYMVSPNIIGLVVDEKACILSNLKPYQKQKNDVMVLTGYHGLTQLLIRNGDSLGYLAGRDDNWYRPFNMIAGEDLDLSWVAEPSNFVVSSTNDPNYSSGTTPLEIYRKTTPDESVTRVGPITPEPLVTNQHHIFLRLPVDLAVGNEYRIRFNNNSPFNSDLGFQFDDQKLRSEAIHVNLYGFEPEDQKTAFLSCWMGDGGTPQYPEEMNFRVVNVHNNQTVYQGQPTLRQPADEPEYIIEGESYNHNRTDVYEMDFSSLDIKGRYKIVVDGIGCSFDFMINDHIWENSTRLLMKGYLHQRSGVELGPPYTDYIRPRSMHPEDGHVVHKVDPEKFFSVGASGQSGIFVRIQASILEDTSVPEAWGGWMDAGDFDRRMTHLYAIKRMMYLYELNPEYFEQTNYNIPESKNNIPDIIDEGLYGLNIFRRTQGIYEEGGVSWWIESIEHPRHGETSWLNSLPTALVPPTPEACIDYSGVAAQMAIILKKYDENLAAEYRESAVKAMDWVTNHLDMPFVFMREQQRKAVESYAFINLFRLTDDEIWHKRFLENMNEMFPDGIDGNLSSRELDAVTVYSIMEPNKVDQDLQEQCRTALITMANDLLAGAEEGTYKILRSKNQPLTRLATLSSKVLPVVMAHSITGDDEYKNALTNTIQYTMGLNPMNRSYISGLGPRSFMPYHHDWHADMLYIPTGLPNFGPSGVWYDSRFETDMGLYPAKLNDWPLTERCFNQMWVAPLNEFTPQSPMGELLLLTGYLASSSK